MIAGVRALSNRPFNVNVFVHQPTAQDSAQEAAWLAAMAPLFREFDAEPPTTLRPIYRSFVEDDDMLALLVETAPAVVSFHFGLPDSGRIAALKNAGASCWQQRPASMRHSPRRQPVLTRLWRKAGRLAGIAAYSIRTRQIVASALSRLPDCSYIAVDCQSSQPAG
jgi:hypothetical protein